MSIEIIGTGMAIPPKRVTNDDLAEQLNTSDEWIRSHTGIGARHIAGEEIAASDLGAAAARDVLTSVLEQGLVPEKSLEELVLSLDLIVLGSASPDYYGYPATACIVQGILGAKNAAAMDIPLACSSFIYSLETAAALLSIDPRRKRALVICSEILSRFTNWEDRSSCVLFGDGAGAVLLEKTGDAPARPGGPRGLVRTIMGCDGTGWEHLILRRGGSRNPWKKGETVNETPTISMNGQAVYNFAVRTITETVGRLMLEENLTLDDIALIVPHQANARIIQAAAKRLKVDESKFFLNMEEYANTSSASIPIALNELNRSGRLKKGDVVITVGFGSGLSYGGNLIVW